MQKYRTEFDTSYGNEGFIFQIINSLIEYWGVRLTCLDCKKRGGKPPGVGGTPHMEGVGMLVGNFELNP